MSNKEKAAKSREGQGCGKRGTLSGEIIGLLGASAAVAVFLFGFLRVSASSIVTAYFEARSYYPTELQEYTIDTWITGISLIASITVFIVLFLFLLGQRLTYLRTIIKGIDALHTHRMDFILPLEGNNELTELAESINLLSEAERQLKEKEQQLSDERQALIRSLSHDIRTPLTSILSYSQYLQGKDSLSKAETDAYAELMQKKAEQIKHLTDRLLEEGRRNPEFIENGRLLMEQLAEEWRFELEETFDCVVDYSHCPAFSGELDVGELQRIFDNLASNVSKYADTNAPVHLQITGEGSYVLITQRNTIKLAAEKVESNQIGLESIRRIAAGCNGKVTLSTTDKDFCIKIFLSVKL